MTEGTGTPFNMPVVPAGMGGYGGDFGMNGAWWIVIILAMMGWGNGFGGGWGGNGGVNADLQRGFDQSTLVNGQQNILTALNNNQMASMNQNFTMQSAFQNCCCENRLGTADLKYTVANEGAATRISIAEGVQSIKDQMVRIRSTQRMSRLLCCVRNFRWLSLQLLRAPRLRRLWLITKPRQPLLSSILLPFRVLPMLCRILTVVLITSGVVDVVLLNS